MIGDPSGRNTERQALSTTTVEENVSKIGIQLSEFFARANTRFSIPGNISILNNYAWYKDMNVLQFLSDIGRYARVGNMLAKDSVKNRMAGEGLSFTEFSYQLLQAYDFFRLSNDHKVNLQIGGSDQWGNIVAGTDYIRKRTGEQVEGLTIPLLTTASGEKFGKSAGNAIWLDSTMTSPFEFYQFFLNTTDDEVERLLKTLTFLSVEQIVDQLERHSAAPEERHAQRLLAQEVTLLVHGEDGLNTAEVITRIFFESGSTLIAKDIEALERIPELVHRTLLDKVSIRLSKVLTNVGTTKSRNDAEQIIKSGGVYLHDKQVTDTGYKLTEADFVSLERRQGRYLLLRVGKNRRVILV